MRSRFRSKQVRRLLICTSIGIVVLSSVIPIRLAIALQEAPAPQAILVLEGNVDRIRFSAQFSKTHPNLPIWISGNPDGKDLNLDIFRRAGISQQRLHFDFCATDTVTNFTCNVSTFAEQDIRHVYVITSDYHMSRSQAIAALVFGSHGIAITAVPVESQITRVESPLRTIRDCIRSIIWIFTGITGARFNPALYSNASSVKTIF